MTRIIQKSNYLAMVPMRVSQDEKDRSRARIVGSAARMFRERGIAGTSLADVMADARMTHGGFYRHFSSKDDLLVEALSAAFAEFCLPLEDQMKDGDAGKAVAAFRDIYLSDDHATHAGMGCPVAALGTELLRGTAAAHRAFGRGIAHITGLLASGFKGSPQRRKERAIRDFAMQVGAVVIARASDPDTSHEILAACRASRADRGHAQIDGQIPD